MGASRAMSDADAPRPPTTVQKSRGQRPFNPLLMERTHLQAEGMETAAVEAIRRMHRDLSNQAAIWQPGPCPDDWGTNQERNQS